MLDFRKKSQYLRIADRNVYVWLYKKENYISYGINGTSLHYCLENYKKYRKEEIENMINEKIFYGLRKIREIDF